MDAQITVADNVQSRDLGEQERMLHDLHNMGGLIAVQALHIRGPLTQELIRGGLDWLQQRYPILRAHIVKNGYGFRKRLPFVITRWGFETEGTKQIPLLISHEPWQDVFRSELSKPIPTKDKAPRLRVTWIPAGEDGIHRLVFNVDHAVADAQAGVMHARDFMEFLGDPSRLPTGPAGLPPPMEALYKKSNSGQKGYMPALRLHQRRVPLFKRRTSEFVQRHFTVEETQAIYAAMRKKRTTMHGTVAAAMLEASHVQFKVPAVTCISTMEFRRLCKPPLPTDTYGSYVDLIRTKHELGGEFWATAKEVAFSLISTVAKDQEVNSIMEMPTFSMYRQEWWKMASSGMRLDALGFTTAGDSNLRKEYGAFQLADLSVLVAVDLLGAHIFTVTSEIDGRLELWLLYASGTMEPAEVEQMADYAAMRLKNLPE